MNVRRILPVLLLCAFCCGFAPFPERAWSAVPPAPPQSSAEKVSLPSEQTSIPGPLRSFLRMTAISQHVTPEEVLPLLARNVVMSGYEAGRPTEFLVLVNWYMDQARELETLAGPAGVIRVSSCDEAKP